MTNEQLPGLVGMTWDYLCDLPGVDTGLARGGALEVVTRLVVESDQYSVPGIGLAKDVTKLSYLDHGNTLVGPELDCKCVINAVEEVLANVIDENTPVGPLWPAPVGPRTRGRMSRLSYWTQMQRPGWIPPAGESLDCELLVGASGVHREVTHAPSGSPAELVRDLRAIASVDGPVLVRMDPYAAQGFDHVTGTLVRNIALTGDPGPRLRRWMRVLAVLAIGIEPRRPVITEDLLMLNLAAWIATGDHSLLLTSFQEALLN